MANGTSQSSEQQLADLKEQCMQNEIEGKEPSEACIKLKEREEERKRKQRNWLRVVVGVLLGVAVLYVVLHNSMPGSQSSLLSENDLSVMTSMLEQEEAKLNYDSATIVIALKKRLRKDSALNANQDSLNMVLSDSLSMMQFPQIDSGTRKLILDYVCTQYPPLLECCRKDTPTCDSLCTNCVDNRNVALEEMIKTMPRADVVESVKLLPVNSRSYFWLDGKLRYWEVILWSIFGVLCSLLYSGTEFMRKDQFRFKEVYVQVAKFFYTPLCAFIIVAGYDYFSADDASTAVVTVESPMGLVVMSFILGFFSGSTIDLLQRLKYVIFPSTASNQEETEDDDDQKAQQTVVNVNTSRDEEGDSDGDGGGNGNGPQGGGEPEQEVPQEMPQQLPEETPNEAPNRVVDNGGAQGGGAPLNDQGQNESGDVAAPQNTGGNAPQTNEDNIDPRDETGYEEDETGYEPRDENRRNIP